MSHATPFDIPAGATHLLFTYHTNTIEIIAELSALGDFDTSRGTMRFGVYHLGSDRFESLMPADKGVNLDDREPLPLRCPINENRTMKDVVCPGAVGEPKLATASAPKAPRAPAAPKAPAPAIRAPKSPRPLVAKPIPRHVCDGTQIGPPTRPKGGKTAQVWDAADALVAKLGREPNKTELIGELPNHNPSTVSVQFGAWRKARNQA